MHWGYAPWVLCFEVPWGICFLVTVTVLAACLSFLSFFSLFLWDFHPLLINFLWQHSSPVGTQIQHQLPSPLQHSEEFSWFFCFLSWILLPVTTSFQFCLKRIRPNLLFAFFTFFWPRSNSSLPELQLRSIFTDFWSKHSGGDFTSSKYLWQAQTLLSCAAPAARLCRTEPNSHVLPSFHTGQHGKLQTSAMAWF